MLALLLLLLARQSDWVESAKPMTLDKSNDTLNCHPVSLAVDGKLQSWIHPQDTSMHKAATAAVTFLKADCPKGSLPGSGDRPAYMFYPELTTSEPCGKGTIRLDAGAPPGHMHNPAGLYGMLGDALALYYAYSGDAAALALVPPMFDFLLAAACSSRGRPTRTSTAASAAATATGSSSRTSLESSGCRCLCCTKLESGRIKRQARPRR
eukprot:SAG11_NODE_6764_length_1252_cov_1.218560_3_plen_208_part_01